MTRGVMTALGGRAAWPYVWRASLLLAAGAALGIQFFDDTPNLLPASTTSALPTERTSQRSGQADASAIYPAIGAHPLFDVSRAPWRRPPPPPPVMAPVPAAPPRAAPPPPRGYALIGLITTGTHSTALLRGATGKTVLLTEGQMLDGWRVRAIDHGRVSLESGDADYDIAFPVLKISGRRGAVP